VPIALNGEAQVNVVMRAGIVGIGMLGVAAGVEGQESSTVALSAEAARLDVLELRSLLERVHPDPYSGFGGRVAFRRSFRQVLDALPRDSVSVAELRRLLAEVLGTLADGHTGLQRAARGDADAPRLYLPVRFSVASDGVYVSDAIPAHAALDGSLVRSVNGIPVDELAVRTRILFPSENLSGSRRRLAQGLSSRTSARDFIPDLGEELLLEIVPPGGEGPTSVTLRFGLTVEGRRAGPWPRAAAAARSEVAGPFGWRMLADGRVGYLRIHAMWSREAFENMRTHGRTDLERWLTYAYETHLGATPPPDRDEAIARFPSLIEESDALLRKMRLHGATDLIVDLRENGGGFSVIGEPLLYQIFGTRYLESPDPAYFATRVSPELLELRGRSLADLTEEEGREVRMGDLLFDPPLSRPRSVLSVTELLDRQRAHGFSRTDILSNEPAEGFRVAVIVDGATFSAAFDLTYHLHRLGAVLVGVPPSQSPRAFTDSTPFRLTHSGLEGSLSRSAVVYPGIPEEGGAVIMDVPMTWDRLADFDFHPDASIRAALEALGHGG
jgi:hypothetical protein